MNIGYILLVIGLISLIEAWVSIVSHSATYTEVIFLFIGLVASLAGIALVLRSKSHLNRL
jgi:hypothetical protein